MMAAAAGLCCLDDLLQLLHQCEELRVRADSGAASWELAAASTPYFAAPSEMSLFRIPLMNSGGLLRFSTRQLS